VQADLIANEREVSIVFGDSQNKAVVKSVNAMEPFDVVFIALAQKPAGLREIFLPALLDSALAPEGIAHFLPEFDALLPFWMCVADRHVPSQ
jgi:hypothetical protein